MTRLSAAHEAAAMDVLCADKTGTLTRNALEVIDVKTMSDFDRERVLATRPYGLLRLSRAFRTTATICSLRSGDEDG